MAGKEVGELQYLERYYEKSGSDLVILYGQKHMGMQKTLSAFCKNRPSTFFKARACSEREQLFLWANELRENGSQIPEYPEYEHIFGALTENTASKKIIIIEEFQYIVKQSREFMPRLIHFLKNEWIDQTVMVVLCSTLVCWIENSMISKIGSAVYDISGLIKMKECSIRELKHSFPKSTYLECLGIYTVLGGLPELWHYFEDGCSVKENICRHLLKRDSFLHEEALRMVSEPLRETCVYNTILGALASGKQKLNELYQHTGFPRAKISVYLKNLMELEIVEKVFSYDTEGRENARKGIYRIRNRLLLFYFRYLYPNLSSLAVMEPETFYETYIADDFFAFSKAAYVQLCRELLEQKNSAKKLPFEYTKTGEWIGKAGNIDIIAEDEISKTSLTALCSWQKSALSYEDYKKFMLCVQKAKISADHVYLFSPAGFDESLLREAENEKRLNLMGIRLF